MILFALGVLNSFSFVFTLRKSPIDWMMAGLALGGFVVWFVVEIIILQELHWLHLMWGMPVLLGWLVLIPLIALRNPTESLQKFLLASGVLSSLWYVVINIYVPMHYEGYSMSRLTVSELSAIGAPTRLLWVLLVLAYPLLFAAFAWGVRSSGKQNRALRIAGALMLSYAAFNFYWPPMHMRGTEPTLTDTLHITWAIVTNIFMWLVMIFGTAGLSKPFRIYTIASIALHIVFGALTFMEAPNVPTNGPTPTIGLWERINIAIFMLWVIVFAVTLLKKNEGGTLGLR